MLTFVGGQGGVRRIGSLGAPATLVYVPDLAPVGSKATYFPRSVEQDAAALNFLGFLSDVADANRMSSTGSQSGDMSNEAGAWDPDFRSAVGRFQASAGITADTWIGPQTRTTIAAAVARKNASGVNPVPPPPPGKIIPVVPGEVPAKPAALPGLQPVAAKEGSDTTTYLAIGGGVLLLGGLAYYALK
jgi:hypothetical protein